MIRSHDRMMLARAARLALRAHGEAEPNPTVGCIVHDSNDVRAGEGRTARCGGPHAEVVALREAGTSARGGTAWVTLEPCNHHGRTPPCVDALVTAGIRRVVIGTRDPNPVASGGIERLRAAGVVVDVVDDVTGRLRSNTMTAIMGGSGSGKSSLLNALCGRAYCECGPCRCWIPTA